MNIHPEEDSPLSDIFLKNMYAKIRSLLTVEEKISGYRIFKLIDDSASIKKSDADIKILYTEWMSMRRNRNESSRAFAAHIQTEAENFDDTDYEVKPKDLTRKWCKGLGSNFQSIKKNSQ